MSCVPPNPPIKKTLNVAILVVKLTFTGHLRQNVMHKMKNGKPGYQKPGYHWYLRSQGCNPEQTQLKIFQMIPLPKAQSSILSYIILKAWREFIPTYSYRTRQNSWCRAVGLCILECMSKNFPINNATQFHCTEIKLVSKNLASEDSRRPCLHQFSVFGQRLVVLF